MSAVEALKKIKDAFDERDRRGDYPHNMDSWIYRIATAAIKEAEFTVTLKIPITCGKESSTQEKDCPHLTGCEWNQWENGEGWIPGPGCPRYKEK